MQNAKKEIIRPSSVDRGINSFGFFAIHLIPFFAILSGINWYAVKIALILFCGRMFLITGGYHRYFSHKSYKTSRWFQFVLAFLTTTAIQKGPLWWSARHRIHHKHSDKELDIHSPVQYGFWRAHIGWFAWNDSGTTDINQVKDLAKFPELIWLDKYHWIAPVLLTGLCYYLAGWSGVIVGMGWSTVLFWHSTFLINSVAHLCGSQRYETGDASRNNLFLAVLTMGEGWHNNHHHCRSSARQGFFKWWEIDLTYYILWLLSRTGLIWDLKLPSKNQIENNLIPTN